MEHQLSDLQKKLVDMLEWFHNFCVEHQLQYYLLGGTMLGAARHEGFIPWDDDVDIGMPRDDYERFLSLTKGKRFGDLIVEDIHTPAKDFYYGYSKIYDLSTTLVENTRYKIRRGIYLDLFPLDGVSNDPAEAHSYYASFVKRYRLLLTRTCAIRKERKWYKNAAILAARLIPNFLVNNKKLMLSIDEACKKRNFRDYEIIGNLYGNWGEREIMKKSVFGKPTLYRFERLEVYGVEDADAYLTNLYGDWRKLPPVEKQVTHHDFLECDLKKPYQET